MIAFKIFLAVILVYNVLCKHDYPDHGHGDHRPPLPPPPPHNHPGSSEGFPIEDTEEISQLPAEEFVHTTNQPKYSSDKFSPPNCKPEDCPATALTVLLILTEGYPLEKFEQIQSFINDVVESCEANDDHEMRFAYTNGRDSEINWATDGKTFDSMQRTTASALNNFQWKKPPKPKDLARSINFLIEKIGTANHIPKHSDKYILIVSNFDLHLDEAGGRQIRDQLAKHQIRFEVIQLPSAINAESVEEHEQELDISEIARAQHKYELEKMDDLNRFTNDLIQCTKAESADKEKLKGKKDESDGKFEFVILVTVAVLLIVVAIAIVTLFYIKSKLKWKTKIGQLHSFHSQRSEHNKITMKEINKMNNTDDWTIPRDQLEIFYDQKLGSGAFCCVYKGKLSGAAPVCKINPSIQSSRLYSDCDVAIKMLPPYTDDLAKSDFFQEMNFMKALNYHPHLICILGTAWEQFEPCLVTEYCINGDLLHFVRDKKEELKNAEGRPNELRLKDLLCFSWQISDGMDFLSSKGCIHRDLAARNILVDNTNTAKIADFGLCRLTDSPLYSARGGRLPIKWMAIESLRSYEYSMKSDVWSFGVLLYELFSLGDVPFPRVQPADMIEHLTGGNRLEQPEYCTDEMHAFVHHIVLKIA